MKQQKFDTQQFLNLLKLQVLKENDGVDSVCVYITHYTVYCSLLIIHYLVCFSMWVITKTETYDSFKFDV